MPRIATDDAARRQEFIWLGPVDAPWPFEARGSAWLWALMLLPVTTIVAWLVIPTVLIERGLGVPGPLAMLAKIVLAITVGVVAGILIIRAVGRHVGPTTPVKHHASVLMHEVSAPRPDLPEVTYRVQINPDIDLEHGPSRRTTHRIAVQFPNAKLETEETTHA